MLWMVDISVLYSDEEAFVQHKGQCGLTAALEYIELPPKLANESAAVQNQLICIATAFK